MILEFTAKELGSLAEYGVVSCGASNSDSVDEYHYVNFQNDIERESTPSDVYFEVDDQINGGYDLVESCEYNIRKLVVTLNANGMKATGYSSIVIHFDCSPDQIESFIDGLLEITKDTLVSVNKTA